MAESWELGLKFIGGSMGMEFVDPEHAKVLGQQGYDFFKRKLRERWTTKLDDVEADIWATALLESAVWVKKEVRK